MRMSIAVLLGSVVFLAACGDTPESLHDELCDEVFQSDLSRSEAQEKVSELNERAEEAGVAREFVEMRQNEDC